MAITSDGIFADLGPETALFQKTWKLRISRKSIDRDRFWEWAFVGGSATWDAPGYVNVDNRAADASGAFLYGGKNYRLHLRLVHLFTFLQPNGRVL